MAARDLARSPHSSRSALSARYRSLFVIGRGGMGTVEAALELHADGAGAEEQDYERVVALKRLLPDATRDARRVEMFLREAKLARMLDHPNIVRAFDYGEVDGELFLAMEYVEGQTLARLLKALAEAKGTLDASLAAHVLAEVCDGLHAAHELKDESGKGLALVHRDVSPQNVMVGCDGHVRLLDFGVAKIEAESSTKTGEVKGKTAYMSPEQAMGDAIDRRSDLFGVGAVLFECLALRRMWGDGTDMDVIRKLALEAPPKLEEAVPSAPGDLCALYTRLVSRDAKDRPANARDVAEELRKLVPQGRDEAARALKELLDVHFGAQAAEQRTRLTTALEEVAPEQARELRQSVIPELSSAPRVAVAVAARPSTASIADATGANPVSDQEPKSAGVAAPASGRTSLWLIVAAVGLVGVVVWRLSGSGAPVESTPKPVSTVSLAATPPPTASVAPLASAVSSSPAPAPSPLPTAFASSRAPSVTPSIRTTAAPRPSAPTASATPTPKPSATTPKPPPDVDDHPF